jgi:ParB family transcriptional regulator, chromosome partitioning protein
MHKDWRRRLKRKILEDIRISEIRIVNPRTRSKLRFQGIVNSISKIGLKRPITVTRRELAEDGTRFDLVCGQGRIEALLALGESTIPAAVVEVSREDQFLMSLIENIARRPPSNKDLVQEVKNLKGRGYSVPEISTKLGNDADYIAAIVHLIEHDGASLVEAVEAKRLPLSIALLIASADDPAIQSALSQAYESGELRGSRFKEAKRIIARFGAKRSGAEPQAARVRLSGEELVREYQRRTREQQVLVKRAALVRERLVLLRSAMRTLLGDEHFVTLLRAEQLQEVPELLVGENV